MNNPTHKPTPTDAQRIPTTIEDITHLIIKNFEDEKPSGLWKHGEPALAYDGTPLSTDNNDPEYFMDKTLTDQQCTALLWANSAEQPTIDGLTWREFSKARGYSEEEIATHNLYLRTLHTSGTRQNEIFTTIRVDTPTACLFNRDKVKEIATLISRRLADPTTTPTPPFMPEGERPDSYWQ